MRLFLLRHSQTPNRHQESSARLRPPQRGFIGGRGGPAWGRRGGEPQGRMARIRETERLLARLKLAWCPSQRLKSQGKRASKLLQTCMPNTRWKWRTWGLICLLFLGVYTVFVFRWVMSVSRKHPVSHGHEAVPLKKGSAEKPGGERKKGEEKRAVETNTLNLDVLYPTEQAAQVCLHLCWQCFHLSSQLFTRHA